MREIEIELLKQNDKGYNGIKTLKVHEIMFENIEVKMHEPKRK
jgi:hypothetical protein